MKKLLSISIMGAALLVGSSAFAQDQGGNNAQQGGAARTQEFNFTDELVQGQLVRPDGETSRVRRRSTGISLIRIREHFVPEMLKSVENL
ncbi:MAG: hypothetical protein R3A52_20965 [Polyangiales bacterium]